MNAVQTVGLVVVCLIVCKLLFSIFQKYYFLKLYKAMQELENPWFDKKIRKAFSSFILPPYTVRMLLIERADLLGDTKMEEAMLEELLHRRLNAEQTAEVGIRGFNYYLGKNDQKKCVVFKERIDSLSGHEQMKKYVDRTFDIVMLRKDAYLDELLAERNLLSDEMKSGCEFLISKIYENRHDKMNAEKYACLSRSHMNMQMLGAEK